MSQTLPRKNNTRLKETVEFLKEHREALSIFTVWLFTTSALIGFTLGNASWFLPKTPLNLGIGFLLLLVNIPLKSKGLMVVAVAMLVGFFMEVIGVATGKIFGIYFYGENLGLKVLEVPLMIGVYWGVLVVITHQIGRTFASSLLGSSLIGASLMVFLDYFMEHMAGTFDFWYFKGGMAPFQNFLSWFIIAFLLQLLIFKFLPRKGSKYAYHLYLSQLFFFVFSFFYFD